MGEIHGTERVVAWPVVQAGKEGRTIWSVAGSLLRVVKAPALFRSGVGLGFLASAAVAGVVLWVLGGWEYYWMASDARAYTDAHRLLRPSGPVGNLLGLGGMFCMLIMHVYSIRKRLPRATWLGPVNRWLEFHIFCGVFGPALITLHTSFKFNGLISVAYWSMVIVVLSGFVGRYLFVRIPRSIRGRELSRAELEDRAASLNEAMARKGVSEDLRRRIEGFDQAVQEAAERPTWRGLFLGEISLRIEVFRFSRMIRGEVADRALVSEVVASVSQRAFLVRRIAYLKKTKTLFDLWRVYHKPLAVLMALIVILHVGIVWYLGYAFTFASGNWGG